MQLWLLDLRPMPCSAAGIVLAYTLLASCPAAGVCFRLWGQEVEADMFDATPPEIVSADLAPLALQLACWGSPDGQGLSWLDAPEIQMLDQARSLLLDLCAVDDKGALTGTGMGLGMPPAASSLLPLTVLRC
jgi:ATP-dependent helicase HrpB